MCLVDSHHVVSEPQIVSMYWHEEMYMTALITYKELSPKVLKPNPNNPNTHPASQLKLLEASIKASGFLDPILVDENLMILSGHGRGEVALRLGLESVPVCVIEGLDENLKEAASLAFNAIGKKSEWDKALLADQLMQLINADITFDLSATGFTTGEIDVLTAPPEVVEDGDAHLVAASESDSIITQPGDVWALDAHGIACGDSLDAQFVQALFQAVRAALLLTDPPYNVPIDGHVCGNGAIQHEEFAMASGEMSPDEFTQFLERTIALALTVLQPGALLYLYMDWRHQWELLSAARTLGLEPINLCVWAKTNGGMGSLYRSQHELCLVFKADQHPHINNVQLGKDGRYRTNVWTYPGVNSFGKDRDAALASHPTVKPVAMLADIIKDVTHHHDTVFDPFLGSGSTLIAAEQTQRRCVGIEIEPRYVDVAIRRWQLETGREAIHRTTGQTFAQRAEEVGSEEK